MQIIFQPAAELELAEARIWYGLQGDGLDAALMRRIDETLQRIVEAPYAYPVAYRQLRRAVVRQFPFASFMRRLPMRSVSLLSTTQGMIQRD